MKGKPANIIRAASFIADDNFWRLVRPFYRPAGTFSGRLTIGITTFMDRFDTCLKPLVDKLAVLFADCRIIITANGHVKKSEQEVYLSAIAEFCTPYDNVTLISYTDPMGLSYLWNTIIRNSETSVVLIMNDDLRIKRKFRGFVTGLDLEKILVATINRSWSHFFVSKQVVSMVGLFDENLREIGGEDDDYLARLSMHGREAGNYNTGTLIRRSLGKGKLLKVNSYGRDMTREKGGYSTLNTDYIESKWRYSNEYFEDAVEVRGRRYRYWKLK